MIDVNSAVREAGTARFTRRISFHETPEVEAWLAEHASEWGRSVASEIRAAVRFWIQSHDAIDD